MGNLNFALDGAWRVFLASLILGAGLPVLFALGIRSLASGGEAPAAVPAKITAYLLFAVVVLGVLLGLTFIVATGFGKALSFEHLYPTIVAKH
ncbi:MAG TPA: hypothetical protein VGD29_07660 [Actinoplanes sp.]|jgi:hypothetical protein